MGSEPRFFVLEPERHGPYDTDAVHADGFRTSDVPPRCPACGREIGNLDWLPPFQAELEIYGQGPGDYTTCPGGDHLVSEKFVNAFRQEKLSGVLSFEPVEVVKTVRRRAGPRLSLIPRYFLMNACFGRGALDTTRSRLRWTEPIECTECRLASFDGVYGFTLEPGTWKGEDIFNPRGLRSTLVVSERFAQFVKDHAITNVMLIPTEQYCWDPYRKGPPTPAALA